MRRLAVAVLLLVALAGATALQADALHRRPLALKLGPTPHPGLIKLVAGEHCATLAFRTVLRVMFYFGAFFDDDLNRIQKAPEYDGMYRHLENAVQLDPYNMDAYYFSQAAFTWEIGHARDVNRMLEYGMRYRNWDYLLPFYAGFNAAYFLKDYPRAARHFETAAKLSGNQLFTTLAARYFHEGGEGPLALGFLETMIKGAADQKTRLIYEQRRNALLAAMQIEDAVARYRARFGRDPAPLAVLVAQRLLPALPVDPYGGTFYLDGAGRIRSTSKFALKLPADNTGSPRGQ